MSHSTSAQDHAGRVALVTGASSGLGRAVAEELAARGASVLLASRNREKLAAAVAAIEAAGGRAAAFAADMTRRADIEAAVAAAVERFGALDAVLFNTGGPKLGSFLSLTDEDWLEGMDATLLAFIRTVRAAVPVLRAAPDRPAHILAILSSSVKEGIDNLTMSNTYRPAIAALIRTLARELGPRHILVNGVAPGRFMTERVVEVDRDAAARRGITEEEARAEMEARIPLGRYGRPRELGRVAAFLMGPENTYVTGQTLLVDGGLVRGL
ncbi:MAG: SDR family oxidoreductase [Firmicutes bacterium]|nr:SDR family oxidoreductase [Bacillota bacterium]